MGLDATVQFRTSTAVKEGAFAVFEDMGISPSAALQLFLQQVQKTKTLPFILTANPALDQKENGYDDWLRLRLASTIKKLDNAEMTSSSVQDVRARLQAKRTARKAKHPTTA